MLPTLVPVALRCESLVDPIGIGRSSPVLSWKLHAAHGGLRDLRQTAYEVRVGSTPGAAELWDSGRVTSSAQFGVTFGGRPLPSGQSCWWSVRTWDGNGLASSWSAPARFTVGLLNESDWKAKWIGFDASDAGATQPLEGASWIWTTEEDPQFAAKGSRLFERQFELVEQPKNASITLTADDRFTLIVNGREVLAQRSATDGWRKPASLEIAPYLQKGENVVRIEVENTSKGYAGLLGRIVVQGGPTIVTNGEWREGERNARVVGRYGVAPWGRFGEGKVLRPATLYSSRFGVNVGLKRATATVSALGLFDLSINGKRVSQDRFSPGWTDYHKRVYARTFDVTGLVHGGANVVGAEVGDGWYSGYVGYGAQRAHYGDHPRLRAQVDLEYVDGHHEIVGSSERWLAKAGPTRVQDFLVGEEFDARLLNDPYNWSNVSVIRDLKARVEPFPGVPVLPYARLTPQKMTKSKAGYILDYGQNLAGFAHLRTKGRKGQTVELRFLEALNADGTPYTANLRGARAIDRYTFASRAVEEWEPRFTFHGFRYLEVVGLGRKPKADEFTAVAISSATPETGRFECSDPMLNKLAKNAWWTQKMNFIDVPTDCPQRDERLGWTGDAQAYVRTATTYSDVQAFFRKWTVALDDDQRKDGEFPMVAPQIVAGDDGGPAWADAGVICPWTIYDVYGDRRLLAEHYPAMRRFVEFTRRRSSPDLLPPKSFHCFGDWLNVNASTPNEVIYEAYFAFSTRLLAQSARVLGKHEDALRYEALFRDVRSAFNRAYVAPDGKVNGDTQTAYVLALGFDLLDAPTRKKAAARLVAKIEERKGHLSTGFVGTRDLMRVLSAIGRDDVAFRLLHNKDYPSWGFEIVNGATTVWERWDGWTPEKGFQDPGMNSFAHYAYGAVMGWVFATVGGIDNATPGFGKIVVAPKIDPRLTWAKTSFESVRGTVRTEWRKEAGKLLLFVEIPPNATAEIRVPGGSTRTVGSGNYRFVSSLK